MSTVNEAFRRFYPAYEQERHVFRVQAKAARSISRCRTAALGGHVSVCKECEHTRVSYNSCRDRHCPQCQGVDKAIWVDKRLGETIDAPYFHIVFTIPSELHQLIYQNQRLLYNLMYQTVAETLLELCQDPRYLGAKPGFFSVLHTWGQDLHYHPHIHTVVMAGGLTKQNKWRASSQKFFIPVRVLAKKFRGKYLHYLRLYYQEQKLNFYQSALGLEQPEGFRRLMNICYSKDWYTYVQETFAGPLGVIKYLGRYTHRIAISNSRIASVDAETVTISARDNKDGGKLKSIKLPGKEFIRRFLMHVLPRRFVKVRYYGVLAVRNRKTKLKLCQRLTRSQGYQPKFAGMSRIEVLSALLGKDVSRCPVCKASLYTRPLAEVIQR